MRIGASSTPEILHHDDQGHDVTTWNVFFGDGAEFYFR